MTKFKNFKAALINLCNEHNVTLDLGYDGVEVFSNPIREGSPRETEGHQILNGGLGDMTNWPERGDEDD